MTDPGVFAVARTIWNDSDFAPEPFTQREAWLWLISACAWKDKRVRGIGLVRGEFSFSVRFLADKWRWSKSRVDRFISMLEKRDMIRDTSRSRAKVYSIKNYNRFQRVGLPVAVEDRDIDTTQAGHERDKEETLNIKKKSLSSDSKSKPSKLNGHAEEFDQFYAAYPKHEARGAAERAYVKALSRAGPPAILDGAKRYASARKGEDPKFTRLPATWLNADGWLDEGGGLLQLLTPDRAEAARDKADRMLHRGKYAEK